MVRFSSQTIQIVGTILLAGMFLLSCSEGPDTNPPIDRTPTINMTTDLIIGAEDQPLEHQLGRPITVRTDEEGNIYIVDRASKQIKVFDEEGNHLKNLGGSGRGPGEFQDMELPVEWTPEGNLVIMDRGKLQYTVISTNGEQVRKYPYNLSDQYFPQSFEYVDGQILSIFVDADPPSDEPPIFDRPLIYIYSRDFQEKHTSLFPFHRLGFESKDVYANFVGQMGSMAVAPTEDKMIYSPGIYDGKFYLFRKKNSMWEFEKSFSGMEPYGNSYVAYDSEQEMLNAEDKKIPGVTTIYYDGVHRGRIYSMDAGIFYLKNGQLVQFMAEWREGDLVGEDSQHLLDIFVQIFDENLDLSTYSYLFSIERNYPPRSKLVNWKDQQDRFYFLNPGNDDLFATVPTVRRFTLDLLE